MTVKNTPAAAPSDCEIITSRTFDAPRELVWKVWTSPEHLAQWWGPTGFRTTTHRMEVKPGGQWRYVMHGPDGRDYENLVSYVEVAEPERLKYKHGGAEDCEPVNFEVTVSFETVGEGKTRVTMRALFPSKDARDFVDREYNAIEGGKQTLARLDEHLRSAAGSATAASDRSFVISRVFRAPREKVWSVWTQREHLQNWFGPKGVTVPHCTLDLKPGGTFHYCMRMADGTEHWGKWAFREIVAPQRLVFIASFADAKGNTVRNPWSAQWPLEMLSTVKFDEHAGIGRGTVVTVEWASINSNQIERKTFEEGRGSMEQGWAGTMEQLGAYLAQA